MKKTHIVKFQPTYKRKMGEEELKLHLQAKRGTGAHKSKKDYNRQEGKKNLKNY